MANPFDLSNLGGLMEQARAMQERLAQIQTEMAARTVEASAGGGMVVAKVSGRLELVDLRIEPEVWKTADPEMLRDLVIAAVNQGLRSAQQMVASEMAKVTGGLPIPGLS